MPTSSMPLIQPNVFGLIKQVVPTIEGHAPRVPFMPIAKGNTMLVTITKVCETLFFETMITTP
jgi:hypothetical protein